MNIQSLFKPLEEVERSLAQLYRKWSDTFAPGSEESMLFYKMSMEEKAHVSLVQYQKRLVRQNPAMFEDVPISMADIEQLTAQVNHLLSSPRPVTVKSAVEMAIQIEESAAEYHTRSAIVASRPEMGSLIRSLARADRQHVEGLREFARAHGIKQPSSSALPRFPKT